ncbi:MAG: hypothetical protein ABF453_02905 [Bifidobacterium psychraerophilum]|uniref:hypothetical protein n=1 Tax=Bifidobacterium psychraerophilum TaxID=218140 RepID=UPI0039ED3B60
MADMDNLDRLAAAYDEQVHRVRQMVEQFGQDLWASFPDYRDDNIHELVDAIVPRVQAGQLKTAQLTQAYLIRCAEELGIETTLEPIDQDAILNGRGVDPKAVYERPGTTVYTNLANGGSYDQAVQAGGLRLLQLIGGDMQLAKVRQGQRTMRNWDGTHYYRRILTGRENCALCVIASTQHYKVDHVMPIHPGCDCNFGPMPKGSGQDWVIDEKTLEEAHSAVENKLGVSDRSGRDPDYRKLILVREHGEYGPTLTWRDQHFTGAHNLA